VPLRKSQSILTETLGNGLKSLKVIAISTAQTAFDDLNDSQHQNTWTPLRQHFHSSANSQGQGWVTSGMHCPKEDPADLTREMPCRAARKKEKCWLAI
jgi:hypothetical protein